MVPEFALSELVENQIEEQAMNKLYIAGCVLVVLVLLIELAQDILKNF